MIMIIIITNKQQKKDKVSLVFWFSSLNQIKLISIFAYCEVDNFFYIFNFHISALSSRSYHHYPVGFGDVRFAPAQRTDTLMPPVT